MAQATILAAGNTEATSTDVTVAKGESVNIGIFGAAGAALPLKAKMVVLMDTPNGDAVVGVLTQANPVMSVQGPGVFRGKRFAYTGNAFGFFSET